MVVIRHVLRKHDALGRHAAQRGFAQHIGVQLAVGFFEPQHRVRYVAQHLAPHIKSRGQDLVGVVEGAQHKGVIGQTGCGSRHGLGQRAPAAVGLKAQRHLRQLFAVQRRQIQRRDERVANQVVDVRRTRAARKAEKRRLHRRRPGREDGQALATGVALQVDEHVDAVCADARGGFAVAHAADVDETARCIDHALAQGRAVVAARRIEHQLKLLPAELFQHFHHQLRHRVFVEVIRQQREARANFGALRGLHAGQLNHSQPAGQRFTARSHQQQLRRQRQRQHSKHRGGAGQAGGRGGQVLGQRAHIVIQAVPVAKVALFVRQLRHRLHVAGRQSEHGLQAFDGLGLQSHVAKAGAHHRVRLRELRLDRGGLHQDVDRLHGPTQRLQHGAVLDHRVDLAHAVALQLLVHRQRLGVAVLLAQAVGQLAQRQGVLWLDVQHAAQRIPGLFVVTQAALRVAEVQPIQRVARAGLRGLGEGLHRAAQIAFAQMRLALIPLLAGSAAGGLCGLPRRRQQIGLTGAHEVWLSAAAAALSAACAASGL